MGDLTPNLSVREFACRCKYKNCKYKEAAHMPLVMAIQGAADHFAAKLNTRVKVTIKGGNRCMLHNVAVQVKYSGKTVEEAAASKSKHLNLIAADHQIHAWKSGQWFIIDPQDLYDYYDDQFPNSCGIGLYSNRVHFDDGCAEANYRQKQTHISYCNPKTLPW